MDKRIVKELLKKLAAAPKIAADQMLTELKTEEEKKELERLLKALKIK